MSLFDLYLVILLLAAITSLLVFFQKNKAPLFQRLIPAFLFTTLGVEIAGTIIAHTRGNNAALLNVFTVIEFVFYFWMFSQVVHNATVKKILRSLLVLYPITVVINKSFIQTGEQFHTYTSGLGSILVASCAVYYFYEVFQSPKPVNLVREPAFWISAGLLFFYCCGVPLFTYALYIYSPSSILVYYLVSLFSVSNILLYSSFIISFLCNFRLRKFAANVQRKTLPAQEPANLKSCKVQIDPNLI